MKYGPTIENMELIIQKAGKKSDGVYRFRGVVYRVLTNRVTHIAHAGKLFERCGFFNIDVGMYDGYEDSAIRILRKLG